MNEALGVYLVRGIDPVLRAEAARDLIRDLVGEGDAALMVEELAPGGDDVSTAALVDAASTPPLLTERRIVVGRDVSAYSSAALGPLLAYLESPSPTSSLVLVAGAAGGRAALSPKLVSAVKRTGRVIDADVPANRRARSSWLAEQLKGAPVRLDASAVSAVDQALGEDLGRLTGLLEVLSAAYGSSGRLNADDVTPFLGEAGSSPSWDLTDAIDRGDIGLSLSVLRRMAGPGGRHPLQIMAVLHGHFSRILRLDGTGETNEAVAAAILGIKGSTYPARKAMLQARRLGHDRIVQAMIMLAEADLDLKGHKGWPEGLTLDVLVARLSRLSR